MAILVTGGAGYIGSHCVYELLDAGYDVIVLDDLSTGYRSTLPSGIPFYKGNAGDQNFIDSIFLKHKIDTVFHFAGSIIVPESIEAPLKYYDNNTYVSLSLLQSCTKHKVQNFIFSSTAAVYGNNPLQMMKEEFPVAPETPYASSKLMTEMMIQDTSRAHGINFAILRYFNVAGADPKGRTGQMKENAAHLIKIACEVALGMRPSINIFGTDYETTDGTCIRDFIHVSDLANAHLKVYELMRHQKVNKIYNCGYGTGYSVLDVVHHIEMLIGHAISKINDKRRPGDPMALTADSSLLKNETGWTPKYNNLDLILQSSLDWEKKLQSSKKQPA